MIGTVLPALAHAIVMNYSYGRAMEIQKEMLQVFNMLPYLNADIVFSANDSLQLVLRHITCSIIWKLIIGPIH